MVGTTGDVEALSLWSGQSVALARKQQPAAEIVAELVSCLWPYVPWFQASCPAMEAPNSPIAGRTDPVTQYLQAPEEEVRRIRQPLLSTTIVREQSGEEVST